MSDPESENKDCPKDTEQPEQPKKKPRKPRGLPEGVKSVTIPAEMVTVANADAERQTELITVTPNVLVQLAVERDLDIDRLGKLLELQMRWEQENARKAFFGALSKFQSELPPILKTDRVDAAKAGKRKFASLGTINEVIRPYLYGNGLSFRFRQHQSPEGISVTCIVSHRDGHSEETMLTAAADTSGGKNAIQSIGSSVTYLQRYTLVSALGLTTVDNDDDGGEMGVSRESALEMARQAAANTATGNTAESVPVQSQQPAIPPATELVKPAEPPKPGPIPPPRPYASAPQQEEMMGLLKELFSTGTEAVAWLQQQEGGASQPSSLTDLQADSAISLLLKKKADKQLAQAPTPTPAPTPVTMPVESDQQQLPSDGQGTMEQRDQIRELTVQLYGDRAQAIQAIWLQSLGLGSAMALTYQQAADRIAGLGDIPF